MFLYSAFHIAAFLWTEMDMVLKSNSMKQIVHTINQDSEQFKYAVFKKLFFINSSGLLHITVKGSY